MNRKESLEKEKIDWDAHHEKNKTAIIYNDFVIGHVVQWFDCPTDYVIRTLNKDSTWSGKFECFKDAAYWLVERYKTQPTLKTIMKSNNDCPSTYIVAECSITRIHPNAVEIPNSQESNYPSGDTIRYKCPDCDCEFTNELPQ